MSRANHLQILRDNLAITRSMSSLKFAGTEIGIKARPISRKFGNDPKNAGTKTNTLARSDSVKTKDFDGATVDHQQYVVDFDPNSSQNLGLNNIIFRIEPANLDILNYRIAVEIYSSFPASYDAVANPPAATYWGYRISESYWYIYCPYYEDTAQYRVKIYSISGDVDPDIEIEDIFMGTSLGLFRPAGPGITFNRVDRSQTFQADSGRKYFLKKQQYNTVSSISLPILDRYTKEAVYEWSSQVGITDPFWVVLDPLNQWDAPSFGASFGAYRLTSMPTFSHDFYNFFSTTLSIEEAL